MRMHTDETEKNYKMAVASPKANHFFLLSQTKICEQKRSGLRVYTIPTMNSLMKVNVTIYKI